MRTDLRIAGVLGSLAVWRGVRCCAHTVMRAWCLTLVVALAVLNTATTGAAAQESEIVLPPVDASLPIVFGADEAERWTKGAYEIWILRGRCYIQQGPKAAEAQQAVLWVKRSIEFDHEQNTVLAYLEGDVRLVDAGTAHPVEMRDRSWLGEFTSTAAVQIRTPAPKEGEPTPLPQVFANAQARRNAVLNGGSGGGVVAAQYVAPNPANPNPTVVAPSTTMPLQQPAVVAPPGAAPGRRLRAFSRSSVKVQVKWVPSPTQQEWVGLISPGVNLIIDGLGGFGTLDISTDRMVIWTSGLDEPDLNGEKLQGQDRPLEIYMEGNVVFREGDRVIYADRMYYNVNTRVGTILDAEILAPTPQYSGMARLKAEVIRQLGENEFQADKAYVTTSRLTNPRYRVASSSINYKDEFQPVLEPWTNRPVVDPATGEPVLEHNRQVTAKNDVLYVGPVPVFYWPVFSTDLEDPRFFLRSVKFKNDTIFGQQTYVDLNMFNLLNIRKPRGTQWVGSLDYLSKRGPAAGTTFTYGGKGLFGYPGRYNGLFDAWAIPDQGLDILGSDRMNLFPEAAFRYRIFERHRQQLPDNFQLTAEIGQISDRNFLEQFYELEWDTFKDQTTGIELKHVLDNRSWAVAADLRVNAFFTQTNQLPRFDHFWLGQSLLGDTLTWYEHTSAEYAQLQIVSTPQNPQEQAKFKLLPWEVPSAGSRFVTGQELDLPFLLGPAKIVPYALGQAGHWGEVIDGSAEDRLYGQAGVRAALPFWSVDPNIKSELLNVNGIAHKVVFDVDASFAGANRNLNNFPLYDQIDDDAQEHFRRRFAFNTFGGNTPIQFDERFYALRYGLAGNVSSPSAEIADEMAAVRFGIRQRWQTKRGPAAAPRIVDWILLDTEAVYFPAANRDNFGQNFGLAAYDFRWHVGERFTLLSNGGYDFFSQGQSTVSLGGQLNRPSVGSIYLGYRSLNGPFQGQVLISQASYRLGPKWFGTAAMSYDFSGNGTIGNSFSLVRLGESFLMSVNFAYDAYKNNVSATFNIEPRFLPNLARNLMPVAMLPGATAPSIGAAGLE